MIPKGWIPRFHKTEVLLHWANAAPFVILILTGAWIAIDGYLGLQRAEWLGDTHKFFSVLLIALPPLVILAGESKIIITNVKEIFSFGDVDRQWLQDQKKGGHSPQGKFNLGQKINAIASIVNSILLQLTGIWLWLSPQGLLPRWLHILIGIVATFLVMGHIFMATMNKSTKKGLPGIFHGWVPRDYMEEHHRLQLDEIERGDYEN